MTGWPHAIAGLLSLTLALAACDSAEVAEQPPEQQSQPATPSPNIESEANNQQATCEEYDRVYILAESESAAIRGQYNREQLSRVEMERYLNERRQLEIRMNNIIAGIFLDTGIYPHSCSQRESWYATIPLLFYLSPANVSRNEDNLSE